MYRAAHHVRVLLVALTALTLTPAVARAETPILSFAEVQAGMRGTGHDCLRLDFLHEGA